MLRILVRKALLILMNLKVFLLQRMKKENFQKKYLKNMDLIQMFLALNELNRQGIDGELLIEKNGVYGLTDTRKLNSGRPSEKEVSIEEKYERHKSQNNLLKAENELIKKSNIQKGAEQEEIILSSEHKFIIINLVIEKYKLKNMISHLCQIAEVSRS